MTRFDPDQHERQYRHRYCLCFRPYLYRSPEEDGVWRCAFCGGIRYAVSPEHGEHDEWDELVMRERITAAAVVLFLIGLLVVVLYKWYNTALYPYP